MIKKAQIQSNFTKFWFFRLSRWIWTIWRGFWWFLAHFGYFWPFFADFSFPPFNLSKLKGENEKRAKNGWKCSCSLKNHQNLVFSTISVNMDHLTLLLAFFDWFLSEFEHFQPFLTDFSFPPFNLLKLEGEN